MHKDKQKLCQFFVVPERGPELLEMPDAEILEQLCLNYY